MEEDRSESEVALADYARVHKQLVDLLWRQVDLIDRTIHSLTTGAEVSDATALQEQREVIDTIALMIQGLGVSLRSTIKLSENLDMSIRDCFGIARSISEGSINVAYILAGGVETARRARRHAMQKTFRDLCRDGSLGGVQFHIRRAGAAPEASSIPGMVEALAEFTRKNGTERTSWVDDDLDEKIRVIEKRFPSANLSFAGSTVSIYRHSSEILHGTYFGIVYFWLAGGALIKSRQEVERLFLCNHFISVFSASFFALHGLIDVVCAEFGIETLKEANSALLQKASDVIESDLAKLA